MGEIDYKIIRTNRRTMVLQVKLNGEVVVRCSLYEPIRNIEEFVEGRKAWVEAIVKRNIEHSKKYPEPDKNELLELKKKAQEILPQKVALWEQKTGLKAASIKISTAKTYHGICTGKNDIRFSCRLMQYPDEAIDYVVLHELAHTVHHNHSASFWRLVGKYMPDFNRRRAMLR